MSDLSYSIRAPLWFTLENGRKITIQEWSLRGVDWPQTLGPAPEHAVMTIPFQGVDISFPIELNTQDDTGLVPFKGLTGRQRETLSLFYKSILSGKMASTADMITSLDTPVDLVPMDETETEKQTAIRGKTPRSMRAAFWVFVYLLIASLVLWTLGNGIWARLSQVDIRNARIEATILDHRALQNGFVDDIHVAQGDIVEAGQRLMTITTPENDAALLEVRGRIALIENRLQDSLDRDRILAARIDAIEHSLIEGVARATPETRATAQDALSAFEGRYAPDHLPLFDAQTAIRREIDTLQDDLRRLRRERGNIRLAADALHIIAQDDGIVRNITASQNEFLPRGTQALVLEATTARLARGWVNQNLAGALYPGMHIDILANLNGEIRHLDGQIQTLEAGIDDTLTPEFGMIVTVALTDLTAPETRATLPHLMPVRLRAIRPWARRVENTITRFLHNIRP
jgi:multidrug efflux pump subunit AcrA (membrane-fusion protein)